MEPTAPKNSMPMPSPTEAAPPAAHSVGMMDSAAAANGEQSPNIDNAIANFPESPDIPSEKTRGERAFRFGNMYGLGLFVNSGLSLLITYNVLPTKAGQAFKNGIKTGFMKPAEAIWKLFGKEVNAAKVEASAGSATEIFMMMISGTIITGAMWTADHFKHKIIPAIDSALDSITGRKPPTDAVKTERVERYKQERMSVGTWAKSRGITMLAVLGIDQLTQGWNNMHQNNPKVNLDHLEWNAGGKVYDNLNPNLRTRIVDFFNRRGKDEIPEGLRAVESNAERGVFREQFRLLSKELSLTLILAMMMVSVTKIFDKKSRKANAKLIDPTAPEKTDAPLVDMKREPDFVLGQSAAEQELAGLAPASGEQKRFTDMVGKREPATTDRLPAPREKPAPFAKDGYGAGVEASREAGTAHGMA